MDVIKKKNYADTYLYGKGDYEKVLHEYLMVSEVVNKADKSFDDIRYEVKKRQVHNSLAKVLDSSKVVLLINPSKPLPRSFKVFACKDIKSGDNIMKVFIDVSEIITNNTGAYNMKPGDTDKLVSYIISAMNTLIYYADPTKLFNNTTILSEGTICFAKMVSYIIDYLRIGNVEKVREKVLYLASLYYSINMMDKDNNTTYTRAKKISELNQRELDVLELLIPKDSFKDLPSFIDCIAKVTKADKLKIDNFVERWIYLYGSGTQFGTELYPAFSSIITNAYVGAYLNNQKTIEKICGRSLVDYTNVLLKIGSELL